MAELSWYYGRTMEQCWTQVPTDRSRNSSALGSVSQCCG